MKDVKELITQAKQGDPEAQFELAYCYSKGEGVEKNDAEAIGWWRELANIVDPDAFIDGFLYKPYGA